MDFKIVALLPAHNEAESIATTVSALRAQTRIPDAIIVICDNCTDATAEIASDHGATVWTTSGNTHKKAGALNYALERVLPQLEDDDAVLVQDADSFLDPDFVAVVAARLDDGYAAVGGNFYARPGGGICGAFQRNEYARYARDNARSTAGCCASRAWAPCSGSARSGRSPRPSPTAACRIPAEGWSTATRPSPRTTG